MPSCSILTNIHPMIGVDIHLGTPGPPAPPVPMPHFVAQVLGGLNTSAKLVPTVLSHNFISLNQGSDIGMGIGHVATNIFFPLYVLTSASVSHFGAFSVLSGGKPTAAAAAVYVNFNMNCASPMNMPFGMVVAPGCNMVGMSSSDYLASGIGMAIDAAGSFIFGKIGGAIAGKLASPVLGAISNIAGRVSVSAGLSTALIFSTKYVQEEIAPEIIGGAIGKFTAGPTGSFSDFISEELREQFVPNYSNGALLN